MDGERARRDAVGAAGRTATSGRKPPHFDGVLTPGVLHDGVGVVVAVDAPAVGGHLGDGVDAADDVGPELVDAGRAREERGHADRWRRRAIGPASVAARRTAGTATVVEQGGRALADVAVQRRRWSWAASRRAATWPIMNMPSRRWSSSSTSATTSPSRTSALGGDAQPAEVQALELGPHVAARRRRRPPARPCAASKARDVRRCRRSGWRGRARSRAARCRRRPRPRPGRSG